jgi:hypothetical protein
VYIHKEVFKNMSTIKAIKSLLPKITVLGIYLFSFVLCWNIKNYFASHFLNLFVGGCTFFIKYSDILGECCRNTPERKRHITKIAIDET